MAEIVATFDESSKCVENNAVFELYPITERAAVTVGNTLWSYVLLLTFFVTLKRVCKTHTHTQ